MTKPLALVFGALLALVLTWPVVVGRRERDTEDLFI